MQHGKHTLDDDVKRKRLESVRTTMPFQTSLYKRLDTVSLAVLDMMEYNGGYIITRINVPEKHRGHKHGHDLLMRACDQADAAQTKLYLEINPSGPLGHKELYAWYLRHGFVGDKLLCRTPKRL